MDVHRYRVVHILQKLSWYILHTLFSQRHVKRWITWTVTKLSEISCKTWFRKRNVWFRDSERAKSARNCQVRLGAVISQDGKPIAFYSRKLNPAQTRYTTTERELLAIVETLKEFRNILLGQQLIVYTDHKNLTYSTFNTERVMRWRLILEEYGPTFNYIRGDKNVVADALSRLQLQEIDTEQSSPN